jgi:excisionase family DNA binding protein
VSDPISPPGTPITAFGAGYDLYNDELLTTAQVAGVMNVSRMTVYRMIDAGELPATRVRRGKRVPRQAVVDYLAGQVIVPDQPRLADLASGGAAAPDPGGAP